MNCLVRSQKGEKQLLRGFCDSVNAFSGGSLTGRTSLREASSGMQMSRLLRTEMLPSLILIRSSALDRYYSRGGNKPCTQCSDLQHSRRRPASLTLAREAETHVLPRLAGR